ncbi:hypothetical protein ACW0TN_12620 [Fusobacterium pseudoperiodonticum]
MANRSNYYPRTLRLQSWEVQKMLERKEWKNLEKLSKAFNNYSPSDLLEKEIDRILKGVKK